MLVILYTYSALLSELYYQRALTAIIKFYLGNFFVWNCLMKSQHFCCLPFPSRTSYIASLFLKETWRPLPSISTPLREMMAVQASS